MNFSQELAGNAQTSADFTVGTTVSSQLESGSDNDWFRIELTQGERYQFEATGNGLSGGVSDPLLRLYQNGEVVALDDDNGPGLDPRIFFTAPNSGTYYLEVASPETQSGQYSLSAESLSQTITPSTPVSLTDTIDWGQSIGTNTIDVYFAEQGDTFAGFTSFGWTDVEISQAMAAFGEFEDVTNLTFNRVSSPDDAEFKLVIAAPLFFAATMVPPGEENAGVGVFSRSALHEGGGLVQGGEGFRILLHEFGHGLGLAHPHDTGGSSARLNGVDAPFGDYGDFDLNQGVFTTLSYNRGFRSETGREPTSDFGVSGTLSPIDIAVLQSRYGARDDANVGATRYELPSTNSVGTFYSAIWDTSGSDSLVHNGSADATLDLRAATIAIEEGGGGFVSRVEGIFGGFTIANGTVIERARGGDGNDILNGNDAANRLEGGAGDDTLTGGLGIDTLQGGGGADTFIFGTEDQGARVLDFEAADVLNFDSRAVARTVLDTARQSGNNAILTFNESNITLHNVDHETLFRAGSEIAIGLTSSDVNEPTASLGNDIYSFSVLDGSLAISGSIETETSGNHDRLIFTDLSLSDVTFENNAGNLDITWRDDTGSGAVSLAEGGAHIEAFEFADGSVLSAIDADYLSHRATNPIDSDERDLLRGTSGDDQITGTEGTDQILGGRGDDILDAGGTAGGWQFLRGQSGNDTYRYGQDSGRVFILSESELSGTADRLVFTDLALSDVTFSNLEHTNASLGNILQIEWQNGSDQGEVRLAHGGAYIEEFQFTDTGLLTLDELIG